MTGEPWVEELFRRVDAKDCDGWLGYLAPDARFRFGNAPAVEGRQAIREAVRAFFGAVSGLRHDISDVWRQSDTVISRGAVTYTRLDGSELAVPFATIFEMDGDLIRDYSVYADISQLY